jgi:hypothetical protein
MSSIGSAVFEKFIEPTLIQPTFVTHLPKEPVPLAKLSPDDPDDRRGLRVLHQRPGKHPRRDLVPAVEAEVIL